MEIEVLEKTENSIKFKVKGGSQSILNFLKAEADSVQSVSFAGFALEHPLDKSSTFVIRTVNKDVDKVFKKVIDKALDDVKDAKKQMLGLFK
jgi:DNA-directed RNA polymerase subunit L